MKHAAHVFREIGDQGEETPVVTDLGSDQRPDRRRAQHMAPRYGRRFRVGVLVHTFV